MNHTLTANAPNEIKATFALIQRAFPTAIMSGIAGDVRHSFGYHLAPNDLPASDYSVVSPYDKGYYPADASALDVKLDPYLMALLSGRLRAAGKANDPRLYCLREFGGTLDGKTTYSMDFRSRAETWGEWDNSHLWHIHLSFHRRYAHDPTAQAGIVDILTGKPLVTPKPPPGGNPLSGVTEADGHQLALGFLKSQPVPGYNETVGGLLIKATGASIAAERDISSLRSDIQANTASLNELLTFLRQQAASKT